MNQIGEWIDHGIFAKLLSALELGGRGDGDCFTVEALLSLFLAILSFTK